MSSPSPLNYAPPPPLHRWKTLVRWIAAAVMLALVISSWWWGPLASRRMQLLYWQHRCMIYTPPLDQVVFDGSLGTHFVPVEWSKFYALFSPPGSRSTSTLFLHEMKKPAGVTRLLAIELFSLPQDQVLEVRVFKPASAFRPPVDQIGYDEEMQIVPSPLKWFAGEIDPSDSSHFTFRAVVDGHEVIHDGWLQNNDTVVFGERKPAAPPK